MGICKQKKNIYGVPVKKKKKKKQYFIDLRLQRWLKDGVNRFAVKLWLFVFVLMGCFFTISPMIEGINKENELASLITVYGSLKSYGYVDTKYGFHFVTLNEDTETYIFSSVVYRMFNEELFLYSVSVNDSIQLLVNPEKSLSGNIQIYAISNGSIDFLTLEDTMNAHEANRKDGYMFGTIFFTLSIIPLSLLCYHYFNEKRKRNKPKI